MPNHVTTRCTVTGNKDEIKRFIETMFVTVPGDGSEPETQFDFNKAIPTPEVLRGTIAGSIAEEGAALIKLLDAEDPYADGDLFPAQIARIRKDVGMEDAPISTVAREYLAKHPEVREAGEIRNKAIAETGFESWYEWSIANWGTKWNAYSYKAESRDPLEFCFDTAWAFPVPVFEKLAEMFPEAHFHCACFDEGWCFAGIGYFNSPRGGNSFTFVDADPSLYEIVYGEPPVREEDLTPNKSEPPSIAEQFAQAKEEAAKASASRETSKPERKSCAKER